MRMSTRGGGGGWEGVLIRNFDFIYLEYFTGNVVALLLSLSVSLLCCTQARRLTHTHARTHPHTHTYNRHLCLSLRVVLTNQLCRPPPPPPPLSSSCSFCLVVLWFVSASLWPPSPVHAPSLPRLRLSWQKVPLKLLELNNNLCIKPRSLFLWLACCHVPLAAHPSVRPPLRSPACLLIWDALLVSNPRYFNYVSATFGQEFWIVSLEYPLLSKLWHINPSELGRMSAISADCTPRGIRYWGCGSYL